MNSFQPMGPVSSRADLAPRIGPINRFRFLFSFYIDAFYTWFCCLFCMFFVRFLCITFAPFPNVYGGFLRSLLSQGGGSYIKTGLEGWQLFGWRTLKFSLFLSSFIYIYLL